MKNVFRQLIYGDQVSLTLADTTEIVNEGITRHRLSASQAQLLGSALSAMTYMGACLKEQTGQVSITLKSQNGELGVSGDQPLHIRGYIDGFEGALAFGEGSLTVVRDDGYSRPFVGTCALPQNGGIDETMEEYYRVSEQLPTHFKTLIKLEGGRCAFAGLAVLQPLPFADEETLRKMPTGKDLEKIVEELQSLGLERTAKKYFSTADSAAEWKEAKYQCHCSREYLSRVLITVGKEELKRIVAEDGAVRAHCHFCNTDYTFDGEDVENLFKKAD